MQFSDMERTTTSNQKTLERMEKLHREEFYTKGQLETRMGIVENKLEEKFEDMR